MGEGRKPPDRPRTPTGLVAQAGAFRKRASCHKVPKERVSLPLGD